MAGKYIKDTQPGICDRCGFKWPLRELRSEVRDRVRLNNRVCPECFDPDHPQYRVGDRTYDDPRPLHDPRPETDTI